MNKKQKRIQAVLTALLAAALLCGCAAAGEEQGRPVTEEGFEDSDVVVGEAPGEDTGTESEDIVILYTNDVHCAAEEGIGYSGVAALKKELAGQFAYVTLVDCGDHTQGGGLGTLSRGMYMVQIMNQAGYDYAILGNHEFDYGLEALHTNLMTAQYCYLGCNLKYTGTGTDPFFGLTASDVVDYGGTKVGFVGVTTPDTAISTLSSNLEEEGVSVVGFGGGSTEALCGLIQEQVDECRKQGADYVVLMGHLGFDEESRYSSEKVIAGTEGIDVVLDAHSHTIMEADYRQNKNGEPVLRTSTGTKFQSVGQLTIGKNGEISAKLIREYNGKDEKTQEVIDKLNQAYEEKMGVKVGSTAFDLTIADEKGVRMVRSRETNLADLAADALRTGMDTKIALVNGGAVRADIKTGDITRGDILSVFPFFNDIMTVSLKGSAILDALEMGAMKAKSEYSDGTNPVGENPSLLHVSGLRYTIDTSVETTVVLDSAGNFIRVAGDRRVKDVYVENEDGSIEPLDPDQYYSATITGFLAGGGDGLTMLGGAEVLGGTAQDFELLHRFIQEFPDGAVPEKYRYPQGRITVK